MYRLCTSAPVHLTSLLLFGLMVLFAAPAGAQVPQTILVDGVNDFDPSNLIDADGGDTQAANFCADDPELDTPMDIRNVYVTNDANNLYIGFEYDRECFNSPQVNLGIAFSYGPEGDGGTTDPFSRKIAWNTITRKPDNYFYAVLDGFNYEVLYDWNGTSWTNISTSVNPGWGGGSNGLNMANDTGFEELALPLSVFGVAPGEPLYIEIWMTQDGTSKPPLDAVASDDVQTSTPSGTVFDVATAVEMTSWLTYVVQNAVDNDPPVVSGVRKDPFDDTRVEVTFNEPVEAASAELATNYALPGSGRTVTTATRNPVATNIVTLQLNGALAALASTYQIDITGVEDLAGNTITAAGGSALFAVKDVTFRGLFGPFLQANGTGSDVFTVEGSRAPLDFGLTLDAFSEMVEVDPVDGIWEKDVAFSWYVGPAGALERASTFVIEWKFAFNLTQYESVGNRILSLNATDPANVLTEHFWDDLDPSQFTDKDIDVIFTIDMNAQGVLPGDSIELAGNIAPLTFGGPYVTMADNGAGQDAVAGDGIFTAVVTFPAGSLKNLNFKYVFNGSFECFGQGDRTLFLNDQAFDTIGGTNGPLVLPLGTFDRCSALAGPSRVVFSVDLRNSIYDANGFPGPLDVRLGGNVAPLVFDPIASTLPMADNGVAPDALANDLIYTVAVVFPDSSNRFLEYKYIIDGGFEGLQSPNRSVVLEDQYDDAGNPQILPLDDVHVTTPVSVDTPLRGDRITVKAMPNPFNPRTTVVFDLPSRGEVSVVVYDARGREIRTLHRGVLDAGEHTRLWDGRADDGATVSSGVYFVNVIGDGAAAAARVVLLK